VINRRQQSVLNGLLGVLRKGAKIEDTRGAYGQ
jgi:hypothetical protein